MPTKNKKKSQRLTVTRYNTLCYTIPYLHYTCTVPYIIPSWTILLRLCHKITLLIVYRFRPRCPLLNRVIVEILQTFARLIFCLPNRGALEREQGKKGAQVSSLRCPPLFQPPCTFTWQRHCCEFKINDCKIKTCQPPRAEQTCTLLLPHKRKPINGPKRIQYDTPASFRIKLTNTKWKQLSN